MPRTGALYTPSHDGQAIAFMFANDDAFGPLLAGAVSIRELEELTELDFFPDMPVDRQELIESAGPISDYGARTTLATSAVAPTTFAGVGNHPCHQLAGRILNGCGQGNLPQVTLPAYV